MVFRRSYERLDEFSRLEGHQVVDALPHADELHRYAQFLGDGNDDTALGRAVQLGADDTG